MLDKAGCVSGRQLFALARLAGRGGRTADANTEADSSRRDGRGRWACEPAAGQQRQAEGRERRF